MRYNETVPAQRRIAVYLESLTGIPIIGAAPTLLVSINGATAVAASGTWTEREDGFYYYTATQAESLAGSFLLLYVVADGARVAAVAEDIGARIALGETDASKLRIAFYLESSGGEPATIEDFAEGSVRISKNGAALANVDPVAIGGMDGAFYVEVPADYAEALGFVVLHVDQTPAMPYVYSQPVVPEGIGGGAPAITVLTTFSADFTVARVTPWQATVADFPSGAEMVVLVHFVERNEMYVARDAYGAWRWPFDIEPDNAVDLEADPATVQLLPRGGWPPCEMEIQIAAAVVAVEA